MATIGNKGGYVHLVNEVETDDFVDAHALDRSPMVDQIKSIMQEAALLSYTYLPYVPSSVVVTKDGTICYGGYGSNLYLLDTHGGLRDIYFERMNIEHIAVHPLSDALYCVMNDSSVHLVDIITGRTTKRFVPDHVLCALAFTNDGSLLVGDIFRPLLTLYSNEFKKIREIPYEGTGPQHIAVCRKTGRIAIACYVQRVVVLDSDFTELYRYTGPPSGSLSPCTQMIKYITSYIHTRSRSRSRSLIDKGVEARDVAFDRYGHLLVADFLLNKGVHVLDSENGQHLLTITSDDIGRSMCLTVTKDDHVVVGTWNPRQLLIFKYLESINKRD